MNSAAFIRKILFIVAFSVVSILYLVFPTTGFAQTISGGANNTDVSLGVANYLMIQDKNVKDGDIVSFSPKGYFLSKSDYDASMVGVVAQNPAISLEFTDAPGGYPVVSSGNAYVNVTTQNGSIKKGDPITSSKIPGVGMRAARTGYIIGAALENYSNTDKTKISKIPIVLNVHYFVSNSAIQLGLFDIFSLSTLATYEEPIKAFKYFIAALTLVLSFVFGFFSFARTANKGLEALGRNPLASRTIQVGIFINISIAIVIVLAGLIVSFIVVRL